MNLKRLLRSEVRPTRVLAWLTIRRVMAIVAVAAVGLTAIDLAERRNEYRSRAEGVRIEEISHRAGMGRVYLDWIGDLKKFATCMASWAGDAESRGAVGDAAKCRALIAATAAFTAKFEGRTFTPADLASYHGQIRALTGESGKSDRKPPILIHPAFVPESYQNLSIRIARYTKWLEENLAESDRLARERARLERSARYPWLSARAD